MWKVGTSKRIAIYVILIIGIVIPLIFLKASRNPARMDNKVAVKKEAVSENTMNQIFTNFDIDSDLFRKPKLKSQSFSNALTTNLESSVMRIYFLIFKGQGQSYLRSQNIDKLVKSDDSNKIILLVKIFGPEAVMKTLSDESKVGKGFNCHADGHTVGRLSYMILGDSAVDKTISLCASGYVHGMLGTFVRDRGIDNYLSYIPSLCDNFKTGFDRLECYHASGHGIMGAVNDDLPKAINLCANFFTDFQRINCYAGAFMENDSPVSSTADGLSKTKWRSRTPHFPCNQFPNNIPAEQACYSVHFPWTVYKAMIKDPSSVAKICLETSKNLISSCYFGYGQLSALISGLDAKKTIEFCSNVKDEEDYLDSCLLGGEALILDYWGVNLKNQGNQYCSYVPDNHKKNCTQFLDTRSKMIAKK